MKAWVQKNRFLNKMILIPTLLDNCNIAWRRSTTESSMQNQPKLEDHLKISSFFNQFLHDILLNYKWMTVNCLIILGYQKENLNKSWQKCYKTHFDYYLNKCLTACTQLTCYFIWSVFKGGFCSTAPTQMIG